MRRTLLLVSALSLALSMCGAEPSRAQPGPQRLLGCTGAPVPDDHLFIALSLYQGATLANVFVGEGTISTVIRVTVAPGDQPITVFALGYSGAIWDFGGDVQRVQRVFAVSSNRDRRVAVKGLPADRVEFTDGEYCQFPTLPSSDDAAEGVSRSMRFVFGRSPDRFAMSPEARDVMLPQADWVEAPSAGGPTDPHDYPGGYVELDPASLVSPVPIIIPETPPETIGLAHLERSGAIRRPYPEEVDAWVEGASRPYRSKFSPRYRLRGQFDYAITRDVMLPAGLTGGASKRFLVLSGVPAPRGDPGHSCVASMDGFRVGNALLCLGDERDAIDRLAKLPPDDALAACRLMDAPADSIVEAVSVYEPQGAVHSAGSKRTAVPINVRVRKAGNVILVLSTYEPAIWLISFGPDTRIVGVLLGGYYKSDVEGIHPDTPVLRSMYQDRPRLAPGSVCAPLHGPISTAYEGGPNAILLDRQVRALIGRPLDGLRGAYKLKDVEIR